MGYHNCNCSAFQVNPGLPCSKHLHEPCTVCSQWMFKVCLFNIYYKCGSSGSQWECQHISLKASKSIIGNFSDPVSSTTSLHLTYISLHRFYFYFLQLSNIPPYTYSCNNQTLNRTGSYDYRPFGSCVDQFCLQVAGQQLQG